LEKENQQLGKKLEESKRKRKKQRKESIEHQELFGKGIEKMILIHDEMKTTLKKMGEEIKKDKKIFKNYKSKINRSNSCLIKNNSSLYTAKEAYTKDDRKVVIQSPSEERNSKYNDIQKKKLLRKSKKKQS